MFTNTLRFVKSVCLGVILVAMAVVGLLGTSAAYGDTLALGGQYQSFYYSFSNLPGGSQSGHLGSGSIDPSSLNGIGLPWVFCTQIDVDVYVPGTYSQTTVNNLGTGVTNAAQIAFLLANHAHTGMSSNEMTALQAAIWKELYGANFQIDPTQNSASFYTLYGQYMTNVGTGKVADFLWLTPENGSSKYQTLVTEEGVLEPSVGESVPEPGLGVLLGLGILAVTGLAIRWGR